MSANSSAAPTLLETGPPTTAAGNLPSAVGASLLVHVAAVLIGMAVGVKQAAEVQVRRGASDAENQLTLQVVPTPDAQPPIVRLPHAGLPEAQQLDENQPVDLPEVAITDDGELAVTLHRVEEAIAEIVQVSQGDPESAATSNRETPPEPPEREPPETEAEAEQPGERPTEAAAATEMRLSSDEPPGAKAHEAAKPLPSNDPPLYPPAAVAEKREGRVILKVEVRGNGSAAGVEILRSSGHADLDAAAIAAVEQWQFSPATRRGEPVAQTLAVPVRFVHTP